MASPAKPGEILFLCILLLITVLVPHTVTSQNLESAKPELEELRSNENDHAQIDLAINEQQGKL
jgi:hypothetical protein